MNKYIGNKPISILEIQKVNKNFHSRYSAKLRIYRYVIINRSSRLALQKNKAWHIKNKLNLLLMKKASKILIGTNDFTSFRSASCGAKSAVRTIKNALIKKDGNKIFLDFSSKSFLQQQVRSMVGCLKFVGEGKWTPEKLKEVMLIKKRSYCAPPAPSHGLYLLKVKY